MSRPTLYHLALAVVRRALGMSRGSASSELSLEERLVLSPKQQVALIRCGGRRFLLASAGDSALAWLPVEVSAASSASLEEKPAPRRSAVRSAPEGIESVAPIRGARAPRRQA